VGHAKKVTLFDELIASLARGTARGIVLHLKQIMVFMITTFLSFRVVLIVRRAGPVLIDLNKGRVPCQVLNGHDFQALSSWASLGFCQLKTLSSLLPLESFWLWDFFLNEVTRMGRPWRHFSSF
jgi:hypothetical protein